MRFIDMKTDGGTITGKIAFYCDTLDVTRQGFYWYLKHRNDPWKYEGLAEKMRTIVAEDEYNDAYGRRRMCQAFILKYSDEEITSERTVYRVMEEIGLRHRPKRKPNGITKADRDARKSEDLLKRDFTAEKPLEKCVTDITEIPARDGKVYVSAIFDCYDLGVLGLAMADNMRAELCVSTLENASKAFPSIRGTVIHSDGGRCHDNARCKVMWARMKKELRYGRYDTKKMTIGERKTLIWRYFIIYWNNRRICSANGGLPPMLKRKQYYESLKQTA